METIVTVGCGTCPFWAISWLWYIIAVFVVFGLGAIWYSVLFKRQWIQATEYHCCCGADIRNGEKCSCRSSSVWPMILQFLATLLVGFMYFILTALTCWMGLAVAVAISVWMKATISFERPDRKKFRVLAAINIGYFLIASLIFICFAMI